MIRFFLGRALIYACCVLPRVAAAGSDVFDGLSPDLIGAELTSVLEGAELACRQDSKQAGIRRCRPLAGALDDVGGVPVTSVEALFQDQLLTQVTVYLPEARFSDLKQVLATTLGDGKDWSVIIRSGMAGAFRDEILLWEKDDLVVIAQQFDQRIGRSSLIYGSAKAMAALLKQIKSTPPGAMRDL